MAMDANDSIDENEADNIFHAREEYFESLQKWLQEARVWQNICAGFPSYYLSLQMPVRSENSNQLSSIGNMSHDNVPFENNATNTNANRIGGQECVIPPLWKRLAAETVDFVLLFFIKMIITFILLESFDIIDFEKYNFETFQKNLRNPSLSLGMTVEAFVMEFFHRIFVCIYEAYFLKGGLCATPGKSIMGICVVKAKDVRLVMEAPQEVVYVIPCQPMGFRSAFLRSVIKSILVSLIFPMYLALCFFKHNRTGYDVICNTLVIEARPNFGFEERRPNH